MSRVKLIKIKEEILADNKGLADKTRARLDDSGVALVNIMSSPGAGKTSLVLRTIDELRSGYAIAVIEADLDSTVDSDKVAAKSVPAVQIETGGFCHVDAAMTDRALQSIDLSNTDLILLENVGNLVCPAESDTGAHYNVVILSVPEGDDKPLKYPTMFIAADIVIVNKIDYLSVADFDIESFRGRIAALNPKAPICTISCKTGDGFECWIEWLRERLRA